MATTVYAALQAGIRIKAPKPQRKSKKNRIGLSRQQVIDKKNELRLHAPSVYWVNEQIRQVRDKGPDGEKLTYCFHDAKAFPPPSDCAPMCRCGKCLIVWEDAPGVAPLTPPDVREGTVVCIEHIPDWMNEAYGPSPSGHAIAFLQHRNLRLEEWKLESEKTADLVCEIRRFKRNQRRRARQHVNKSR